MDKGIVVGCDLKQQWLLPWWWQHYSAHNAYPVVFVDFGMSEEALAWCQERGACISLPPLDFPVTLKEEATVFQQSEWQHRYGEEFWISRCAWLKKPFALSQSPFAVGVWLDVDCQIRGSLEPLFHSLNCGAEIALAKDREQHLSFLFPDEVHYNSGVIVFRRGAKILQQWVEAVFRFQDQLPGDQEMLSRAIFLHQPSLVDLPLIYNWPRHYGFNRESIVYHFCSGLGKIEILESIPKEEGTPEFVFIAQSLFGCVYGKKKGGVKTPPFLG